MLTRTGRLIAFALVSLLSLAAACGFRQIDKANELINSGNASVNEGNKLLEEATAKRDELFDSVSPEQYLSRRDSVKAMAEEAADKYEKSAALYREAAAKFDQASKFKIDERLKEYLQLKSQEFAKRAEQSAVAKETPQAFMESSDAETFHKKWVENKERTDRLQKEAGDLAEKSNRIQEDNKNIFNSNSR